MSEKTQDYWIIKTSSLFELINGKRKRTNKTPIDNATIGTRLALKAHAIGLGRLELGEELVELRDERYIGQLITTLNELFDLSISRTELNRYLDYHDARRERQEETNRNSAEIVESSFGEEERFITRLARLFKGSKAAAAN